MDIDPAYLQGKSKREILRWLIDHVTTSEEEQEEKEHRSGSSTDLNLYLLDNQGYEIGSLDEHANHIIQSPHIRGHAKNFVKEHTFSEEQVQKDTAIVSITTPDRNRTDDCIWLQEGEYIWVLTTERQEWRQKTVENLIKYLPQVERLYLSSDYLEKLTGGIKDSYLSGFTAQYHAPYADRKATLMFHGGRKDDLRKARKHFDAKPTRIEFDQTNSPAAAIEGSVSNRSRLSIQSVRNGSEEKAVDTLLNVSDGYQELDKRSFEINKDVRVKELENGFSVDGFTAIELTNSDRDESGNGEALLQELKEEVLNGNQYRFGDRSEGTIRVFDTYHDEMFDIAVEAPDIIIYPRQSTTALSLRDIVQEIFEFDSTYDHEKVEGSLSVV